jgi:hypothetical protein
MDGTTPLGETAARAFAPEAHMPRTRRLVIGPHEVIIEAGIGLQHHLAWLDCDAVLRFPDRLELVYGPTSVVIRASEWHRGEEALALADAVIPSTHRIEVMGEPEPDVVPYRLWGLARHSAAVLVVALMSTMAVSGICLVLAAPSRRAVDVVLALAFVLPVPPLVSAIRRRLAVPRRWRARATQSTRGRVRFDSFLARSSERTLRTARIVVPLGGVLIAFAWWCWTGDAPIGLVVFSVAVAAAMNYELRRRRHR